MADVLKVIISSKNIVEGAALVSVDSIGNTSNNRLAPAINNDDQMIALSGVLATRFDDTGYYYA
jgi:hypothetical protein